MFVISPTVQPICDETRGFFGMFLILNSHLRLYVLCAVKYIREVSPLFKKSSMSADLPWDGRLQSPNLSSSDESPKSGVIRDRKVIPLKMSFISRNLTMPDLENRCVCVCVRVHK